MRLAHLDQRLHLHWGEAHQLGAAIAWVLREQLGLVEPARVAATMSLQFAPLCRVQKRLRTRAYKEKYHVGPPPKKPWQLTVRYDEVVALMRILPRAPAAGQAWGEVQQASFALERYIDFTQ